MLLKLNCILHFKQHSLCQRPKQNNFTIQVHCIQCGNPNAYFPDHSSVILHVTPLHTNTFQYSEQKLLFLIAVSTSHMWNISQLFLGTLWISVYSRNLYLVTKVPREPISKFLSCKRYPGILPIMDYMGRLCLKGVLFQAGDVQIAGDFMSSSIEKGLENCQGTLSALSQSAVLYTFYCSCMPVIKVQVMYICTSCIKDKRMGKP